MGYRTKELQNFQFVGSTFIGVDGSEVSTLDDLIVNCDLTGDIGKGWQAMGDAVVELDSNGSFVRKIVFVPQYVATEFDGKQGWYEENAANDGDLSGPLDDTPITFGLGVQTATGAGDAGVTFAGAVKQTATVTAVEGFMIVANCAEKAIALDDLIVNCDLTGDIGKGWQAMGDAVVELDSNGSFVRKIVFVPQYVATEFDGKQGWYEENAANDGVLSEPLGQTVTFQPGEAFQVATGVGGDATVSFKSALAD